MEERTKRGRECIRDEGWKRGGRRGWSTVEKRDEKRRKREYSRDEGWREEQGGEEV